MKKNKSVIKAVLMVSQIGISMIVPIFVGASIGYWLDQWMGTGFFFLVFLVFGISAAFRNIYILTKPFYAEDLKREQEEQAYWDSLKNEKKRLTEEAEQVSGGEEKDPMQEIEEEFDAWRKRNGR